MCKNQKKCILFIARGNCEQQAPVVVNTMHRFMSVNIWHRLGELWAPVCDPSLVTHNRQICLEPWLPTEAPNLPAG